MRIKYFHIILTLCTLFQPLTNIVDTIPDPTAANSQVVPINWEHFYKHFRTNGDFKQSREILANAVRYNLSWITKTFKIDKKHKLYIIDHYNESGIRPAASVCYGTAVALQCAKLNNKELGVSRKEAFKRITMLVKGVAAAYKSNRKDGKGWGYGWQTALWATLSGQGSWMIWDSLDAKTQQMVQVMVVDEANRFIASGYKVPYWKTPDGHVNSPGDTKAEENAWNATLLELAIAMMPNHPNVEKWKHICTELMLSAYSLKRDLQNDSVVDGKPVEDWLHGFNVRNNGAVINHHIVHPDYTIDITINARSFLTQPLAGQPVLPGSAWNAPFIYKSLVKHEWPSPPYKFPGGTIYMQDKAEVYYPQGTDWSKYRFTIYYLCDADACILHWDKGLKYKAVDWMGIRAGRILKMQARHRDGHMFSPEERPHNPGREQMVIWQAADTYLLFWLKEHHAIFYNTK